MTRAARVFLYFLLSLLVAPSDGVATQTAAAAAPAEQASPLPQAAPEMPPTAASTSTQPATPLTARPITVKAGQGELLQFTDIVSRVSVSEPTIADAVVVSPHEVVLNGKAPGNTTALVWHGDVVSPYEVTVEPDLSEVQRQLRATLPQEQIQVSSSKDAILLTGVVSDAEVAQQAAAIASIHARTVVNLLQAPPPDTRQIMLQVKFATVDRTALSQLGVNLFAVNNKLVGTSTTQQFQFPRTSPLQFQQNSENLPEWSRSAQVTVSDLLNLFAFRPDLNFGATIRLLQSQNLLEILAEPNLITVSGREASFLAGGEFPFPVITTTGTGAQAAPVVTIQFREFGVRLSFAPTVEANGLIHLKVRPEVSSLDFANALTIQGFLIPAISTRKAETEVELREGESFAIAGLIDNRVTEVVSKIPGFGDVPILGRLFRTRQLSKANTELLVVITPRFVKPLAAGETPPLPQFPKEFLEGTRPEPTPTPPQFVGPRGHEQSEPRP